jgi:hypothetical protein
MNFNRDGASGWTWEEAGVLPYMVPFYSVFALNMRFGNQSICDVVLTVS